MLILALSLKVFSELNNKKYFDSLSHRKKYRENIFFRLIQMTLKKALWAKLNSMLLHYF